MLIKLFTKEICANVFILGQLIIQKKHVLNLINMFSLLDTYI